MAKPPNKIDRLRQEGILNTQPQRVLAAWFQAGGFFDANDLVQVKYEMLRHARQEGVTKSDAASLFGLPRRRPPVLNPFGMSCLHRSCGMSSRFEFRRSELNARLGGGAEGSSGQFAVSRIGLSRCP